MEGAHVLYNAGDMNDRLSHVAAFTNRSARLFRHSAISIAI
jgi:hypothetical protein